ncbi:chemotaxis protein CheW [Shewanella sp. CG12_big_fil_rev_8_21_14_0_65_47_15]|uniref:chemotaxis protein CheW n=1 Tax=Shewanella sp. CG12_big_fil_rev_8_21_14_0_65_47_15 TaxID=1975537 RepID=UPI000CB8A9AE|nr:chemotaxis protein CheW [Shewanella sp. CG12_big_fil_rev_8_21_14_0_65_47_15]PIW59256.1 MAG: chemotaxis protein CheW [Shewanella sp. CG12_big_fil_rev_8_21_14_0_65_47_15]
MGNLIKADAITPAITNGQYLTFSLRGEYYAVTTSSVKEIIEYGQLTKVPMMPASIRGVINLRGAVVPVIDLGARFGTEQTTIDRRSCIVILEVNHSDNELQVIGVVVDAVNEVLEIATDDIEPAPAFGANIRTDFMLGMGIVGGRLVILLDVGKVLSVDELAALSASAAL